jgi:hypothetical protein
MGALIGAGVGLLGSSMTASSNRDAAASSAAAQVEAARIAAEAAKFKPIGTTTRFGSSQFGYNDKGDLSSAGYTMSPELLAQQNQLMTSAGAALPQAGANAQAGQGLFNLGQQYAATNPQEAAAQWMKQQQAILQPGQDQTYAALQQQLQNTGRGGFSVAQGGGMQSANPEMAAYYNSLAQQQNQLAGQATQMGQNQVTYGAGLMGTGIDLQSAAYNPYKTQFGLAQGLESAAQQPLDISSAMAGRTTAANQVGAAGMLAAQNSAANLNYRANTGSGLGSALMGLAGNQQLMSGLGNWLNPSINTPASPQSQVGGTGFGSGSMWGNQDLGGYL